MIVSWSHCSVFILTSCLAAKLMTDQLVTGELLGSVEQLSYIGQKWVLEAFHSSDLCLLKPKWAKWITPNTPIPTHWLLNGCSCTNRVCGVHHPAPFSVIVWLPRLQNFQAFFSVISNKLQSVVIPARTAWGKHQRQPEIFICCHAQQIPESSWGNIYTQQYLACLTQIGVKNSK